MQEAIHAWIKFATQELLLCLKCGLDAFRSIASIFQNHLKDASKNHINKIIFIDIY